MIAECAGGTARFTIDQLGFGCARDPGSMKAARSRLWACDFSANVDAMADQAKRSIHDPAEKLPVPAFPGFAGTALDSVYSCTRISGPITNRAVLMLAGNPSRVNVRSRAVLMPVPA